MMEHLYEYLLFFAKVATVVAAVLVVVSAGTAMALRRQASEAGHLEVRRLNDRLRDMKRRLDASFMPARDFRKLQRSADKAERRREKASARVDGRRRVFALRFDGDLPASGVDHLRNEITAILTSARPQDEVVVRIESAGGMVHGYGLAASQLQRVKQKGLRLVAAVDKVAASGGYLMASVADHIVAAPFALVGSIGVVAQIPNVHRFLKNRDVDVEVITAGKYKRTLSVLGENSDEGRAKFRAEIEDVHLLFQDFVAASRPDLNMDEVATGEAWYGRRALDRRLVDELATSDEYLTRACADADVYEVRWVEHKKPVERLLGRLTEAARAAPPDIRFT